MITLNLISQVQQKEIKLIRLYYTLKNIVLLVLIFTIFLGSLLVGAKIILRRNYQKLNEEAAYIRETKNKYAKEIQEINNYLKSLEAIQKENVPPAQLLILLGQTVTANIQITNLSLSLDSQLLKIKGLAKSREDFLNFQKSLKDSKAFEEINIPISAILKKEDLDFLLETKINLEELLKLGEENNES